MAANDILLPLTFQSLISLTILITYLIGLINAARTTQWVWFAIILVIPVAVLPYFLIAYQSRADIQSAKRRKELVAQAQQEAKDAELQHLREELRALKQHLATD